MLAYIDDLNILEKVRHCDGVSAVSTNKQITYAHAYQSEVFFRNVSNRAAELNMKVNESKTQVLCVSAARNSNVESYINAPNSRIKSGKELKILGFWFGRSPDVSVHIEKTIKKFRARLWTIRQL